MASGLYNRFTANLLGADTDLVANAVTVALMTDSHTFTASDNVWSDVSGNETSGTNYSQKALSGKSVTQGSPSYFDADNVEWVDATFDAAHAVLFDNNNDLVVSIDFGGIQSVVNGTFRLEWSSSGIIELD